MKKKEKCQKGSVCSGLLGFDWSRLDTASFERCKKCSRSMSCTQNRKFSGECNGLEPSQKSSAGRLQKSQASVVTSKQLRYAQQTTLHQSREACILIHKWGESKSSKA